MSLEVIPALGGRASSDDLPLVKSIIVHHLSQSLCCSLRVEHRNTHRRQLASDLWSHSLCQVSQDHQEGLPCAPPEIGEEVQGKIYEFRLFSQPQYPCRELKNRTVDTLLAIQNS